MVAVAWIVALRAVSVYVPTAAVDPKVPRYIPIPSVRTVKARS